MDGLGRDRCWSPASSALPPPRAGLTTQLLEPARGAMKACGPSAPSGPVRGPRWKNLRALTSNSRGTCGRVGPAAAAVAAAATAWPAGVGPRASVGGHVGEAVDRRDPPNRRHRQQVARDAAPRVRGGVGRQRQVEGVARRLVDAGQVELDRRGPRQREGLEPAQRERVDRRPRLEPGRVEGRQDRVVEVPQAGPERAGVGVDAIGEALQQRDDLAVGRVGRGRQLGPGLLGHRPHAVDAHLDVGVDHAAVEPAEQLGQGAGAEPAQDVHLRQAVVGHDVALGEGAVGERRGVDVGHAVLVAGDVDRAEQALAAQVAIEGQAIERPGRRQVGVRGSGVAVVAAAGQGSGQGQGEHGAQGGGAHRGRP